MPGARLALAYLGTLGFYGALLTIFMGSSLTFTLPVAMLLIAVPAVLIASLTRSWSSIGVPLMMWAVVAAGYSLFVLNDDEFGVAGFFAILLVLYWPLIFAGFALGKGIRWVSYTARGR